MTPERKKRLRVSSYDFYYELEFLINVSRFHCDLNVDRIYCDERQLKPWKGNKKGRLKKDDGSYVNEQEPKKMLIQLTKVIDWLVWLMFTILICFYNFKLLSNQLWRNITKESKIWKAKSGTWKGPLESKKLRFVTKLNINQAALISIVSLIVFSLKNCKRKWMIWRENCKYNYSITVPTPFSRFNLFASILFSYWQCHPSIEESVENRESVSLNVTHVSIFSILLIWFFRVS